MVRASAASLNQTALALDSQLRSCPNGPRPNASHAAQTDERGCVTVCPGEKPLLWAAKHPPRPHKNATRVPNILLAERPPAGMPRPRRSSQQQQQQQQQQQAAAAAAAAACKGRFGGDDSIY